VLKKIPKSLIMKKLLLHTAFPHFNDKLKGALENRGILQLYKKGDVIVKMNNCFTCSYIVLQGSVKAYRENGEGAEFFIGFLKEGQSFGVSAFEDGEQMIQVSMLTFVAMEPTYMLTLSFNDKDALAKKFDAWYKYILASAIMYDGFYINLIDNIAFKKLDIRVGFYLHNLSHITNKKVLSVTHQEIATSLHCSREAVSRALKAIEEAGKISLRHNEIEIIRL
jgi:CRP/FNR family transcriptional regulator, anaerobic regulatory protein